ncbi:MAG: hypothetical protein II592_01510, partial [Muribaculaceae bacterium]|nr:hypothetical protein [Muribaculaceae bacterium]
NCTLKVLCLTFGVQFICIDKEWGLSISGSAFLSCVGKCCKVENGVQKMRLKNKRGVKIKKKEILIAIL